MEKCQYILERNLPSQASADELARIKKACGHVSMVQFGRSAKVSMANWSIPESEIRAAIIRHIDSGRKVFHKFEEGSKSKLIPDDVQANVTLCGDLDVYVEVWMQNQTLVVLYAHDHNPGRPRLPQ